MDGGAVVASGHLHALQGAAWQRPELDMVAESGVRAERWGPTYTEAAGSGMRDDDAFRPDFLCGGRGWLVGGVPLACHPARP